MLKSASDDVADAWCSSTAMMLLPATSDSTSLCTTTVDSATVDIVTLASVANVDVVGMFRRNASTPLTYTTTPSSHMTPSDALMVAPASATTFTILRKGYVMYRAVVVPDASVVAMTSGEKVPKPSGDAALFHVESSNVSDFQSVVPMSLPVSRYFHVVPSGKPTAGVGAGVGDGAADADGDGAGTYDRLTSSSASEDDTEPCFSSTATTLSPATSTPDGTAKVSTNVDSDASVYETME
jgi:hypothetical protein